MRSWSSAHVNYLALLLGSQYSTSLVGAQSEAVTGLLGALGSSDPIISMALGYTQTTITPTTDSAVWGAGRGSADTLFDFSYGTIITPTSVFVSGGRHWVNSQYRQQLFTHTSPDTSFLFYYASLLTFEDFGLNFSPAVKELSNRLVGYSVYALHALTSAITPPSTGSDYPHALVCGTESGEVPFIFSDTAIRELYFRSSSSYQFNNVAKPTVCATSSQLLNLRQSAATQLNSASDLSASSSVSAPDYTHVSSTQFFNISAAGLALQVKLADSVQAQAALSTSATYVQSSTPVSDLNPVGGLGVRFLNSAISSDSAYSALEQQPVALTANVTAMPLTALTLLDLGTIFALDLSSPEIKASVIYVPAYSVPANLTQPTFITGQSADFSALHDVRPHLPNFFGYTTNVVGLSTNSPQFTLGDFFTNATIANSQRTSGLVGSNIFSFFGSSSNWHNGVDSVKPIRLGAKLQDPSIFCFKLSDLPTGRIKFANKPLFDWSHSWGTQVQTYGLPIYKMYRACLIRKVNCAFWSASSTSINTSEMQQLIWSGNTASVYLPYKNMDKPLMLIPRLFYHTNNAPTQVTSTHAVLDRDLVSFFKSHVIALPTVHEEFDINFVYRH
jgi:hypothetical protein